MRFSLKTESDYVRSRLAQYGSDLISLGLDGYRLDAAKREWQRLGRTRVLILCIDIPVTDLQAIFAQINTYGKQLYITQEVVAGAASVKPVDYVVIGTWTSPSPE